MVGRRRRARVLGCVHRVSEEEKEAAVKASNK